MDPGALVRNLFAGVNRPRDPNNLTDLERRHVPTVESPPAVRRGDCFPVTVEVGRTLRHPNERGHFIEFIDLYADEVLLAHVGLTAVNACPKATVTVSVTHGAAKLRAMARCNLHGMWMGESPITVLD